ncbi:hypothetical protein KKC63_02685 [Patescibacteria group bacterium]|nr:hypothetical protein [Patescibacteria group bacterium]MBU4022786.1 hypothetical protein [Patescibacteria group bacterium]
MPKVFYVLIVVAGLTMVVGGFFLWSSVSEDLGDIIPAVKMESPENYEIIETDEGISVENSNIGLKFKVPEGWKAEKQELQLNQWAISIYSSDVKIGDDGMLSDGCGFSAWVEEDEGGANAVRFRINDPEEYSNEINGIYEAIQVDGRSALKMILSREGWGAVVGVKVPIEDRIIIFDTLFRPNTEQRCSQEFNQFLEQVEIE